MSTPSYQNLNTLKTLAAEAGESGIAASVELTDILNSAPSRATAWPTPLRNEWCAEMEHVFENVTPSAALSPEQCRLLKAMLDAELDSPKLREHYAHYFRAAFPRCKNTAGILEAIGMTTDAPITVVIGRLRVFAAIQPDEKCWDAAFGLGIIVELDETTCQVKLLQERERIDALQHFLDKSAVIKAKSPLANAIDRTAVPCTGMQQFIPAAMGSIVSRLDINAALVQKILVPAVYASESALSEALAPAKNAQGSAQTAKPAEVALTSRWDYSRSLVELETRLEKTAVLEADDLNLKNVQNILTREAPRSEMATRWANVVAIIGKSQILTEALLEFLKEISAQVIVWNDQPLFVEVTDKIPGKQVLVWLQITKAIAGIDYLIAGTLRMPFRLWPHAEQALAAKDERQRFTESVFQDFKEGRPTPEHYAWLWKAPKSDLRTKYLSDSYLLFKTLHKDLKGSYLKSQRALHKLLMNDANFQKAVMKEGDLEAITNLVRCVKRVPLLDSSEKQSLLVKIVRSYPEARSIVEEKSAGAAQPQEKETIDRITSIHSYIRLQQELDTLVNEKIPANTAAIEDARSRGDLSENSEYKYAKEQQRMLGARRSELERNLNTCKPIDFADQDVNEFIIPGSIVTLHFEDDSEQKVTLLGLFDTDSEKKWFSYDSPMGRVLLAHKVGEKITVPAGKTATIAKLEKLSEALLDFLRK